MYPTIKPIQTLNFKNHYFKRQMRQVLQLKRTINIIYSLKVSFLKLRNYLFSFKTFDILVDEY